MWAREDHEGLVYEALRLRGLPPREARLAARLAAAQGQWWPFEATDAPEGLPVGEHRPGLPLWPDEDEPRVAWVTRPGLRTRAEDEDEWGDPTPWDEDEDPFQWDGGDDLEEEGDDG